MTTRLIPSPVLLKPLASITFYDQQVTQINYLLGKEGLSFICLKAVTFSFQGIGLINSKEGQRRWLPVGGREREKEEKGEEGEGKEEKGGKKDRQRG